MLSFKPTFSLSFTLAFFGIGMKNDLFQSCGSQHQVFSNESALHIRCPEYWSFTFIISPSNKHSGQISSRLDWLDLLAHQGTIMSLLQHHRSKYQSVFSFLYSPTLTSIHDYWKNHSLDYTAVCSQSNVSAFKHTV